MKKGIEMYYMGVSYVQPACNIDTKNKAVAQMSQKDLWGMSNGHFFAADHNIENALLCKDPGENKQTPFHTPHKYFTQTNNPIVLLVLSASYPSA